MKCLSVISRYAGFACAAVLFVSAMLCDSSVHAAPSGSQSAGTRDTIKTGVVGAQTKAMVVETYGKLPLSFEANRGQTDARVKFFSRTNAYTLFLTSNEAILALHRRAANNAPRTDRKPQNNAKPAASSCILRMKLRDANASPRISGGDELPGKSNYFIGNDPARWRSNVPTYARVKYEAVYPGVDLVYYGNQRQIEYDFIVAPGADPHRIAFDISGSSRIRRDESGDLIFNVGDQEIRWHKPAVYQEANGTRRMIEAEYLISNSNRVSFELANYDISRPLYIDPLIYSTYLGGSGSDLANAIAVDAEGNAYIAGGTSSVDFPLAGLSWQTYCPYSEFAGCQNGFVSKIDPTGTTLLYSTFLGGSGSLLYTADAAYGIAIDSAGDIYVTGATDSQDFPVTKHAFQRGLNPSCSGYCTSAFVTKFNPSGSALLYSTYFGGSGGTAGAAIAIDKSGHAYITGTAGAGLPATTGAFEPTNDGFGGPFVTKFNPKGSNLVYSTYVAGQPGARGINNGTAIAVDKSNHAYITGATDSSNFPTTALAFEPLNPGDVNAFVTKLNGKGSALMYSSYLGGNDEDYGQAIAVDAKGDAYVAGGTYSTNFPVTSSSLQPVCGGGIDYSNCWDAFVTKINPKGTALVYSTYLGGSGNDFGYAIALDGSDNVYVAGTTVSTDFPVLHPLQPVIVGPVGFSAVGDAFVAKLNPAGSALVYSTFLGGGATDQVNGIAVDGAGNTYVAGSTNSSDFPLANPLQPFLTGADAFVAAISAQLSDVTLFPLHLNFGFFPIGSETGSQVSVLNNASGSSLNISSISITGPDSADFAQTNNCPASLPAGSSCSITATFTPSAFGNRGATVTIASDGPAQNIAVNGFGQIATQMTLTSYPNPSTQGQTVVFTSVTTSAVGPPPGGDTVYFITEGKKGGVIGTATMDTSGVANFATSQLTGTVLIEAYWIGDSEFQASTSNTVQQVVNGNAVGSNAARGKLTSPGHGAD